MKFFSILLSAMFLSAAGVSAADAPVSPAGREEVNSVLASVNGDPISLADLLPATRQKEYQAYAAYAGKDLEEAIRRIRMEAVEEEIDRKLVLADYRAKPFDLPEQEVESELDRRAEWMGCRSRAEFIRRAREAGTTIEKLRERVREDLIVAIKLHEQEVAFAGVTPREVYEYFQQHKEEFVKPEALELGLILLPAGMPELETVSAEISAGLAADPGRFSELARLYSAGPAASEGGNLGVIERRRLRPEFAAAMPELAEGRVYGPVRTTDGVNFLKVIRHLPASGADFRAREPEIRRKLETEAATRARRRYLDGLRAGAILRYFF